ncbi:MAG: hypothetical protein D6720_03045 [Gammaproteobacteria bacterium]|nr:MAG: hypothetical protein D6720_03045 [Gammaproteobacteria bacterium]
MSRTEREIAKLLPGYPANITKPVADLIDRGVIDQNTVVTVREVAGRKGERHRFLYHLLLVEGLRKQGVPVDDTVMMAREAGRKVNLHWSPARWRDEHNRLARWATLKKLAEAAVTYDLADVEAKLPDRWPGYLIRSSRRLGMEGLRQRHCVASYDARIRLGSCAIAVVFVDRQRYTVELRTDKKGDLSVVQIKGRFNRAPTSDVQQRILEVLGLPWQEPVFAFHRPNPERNRQDALDTLRQVLPILRAARIDRIHVYFDGSGDSGMIEEPSFYQGKAIIKPDEIEVLNVEVPGTGQSTRELLDKAFEQYLDSTNVDWYNNDGGFGEFTLDVATGHFEAEVNTRYTESSCEHAEAIELEEPREQVA